MGGSGVTPQLPDVPLTDLDVDDDGVDLSAQKVFDTAQICLKQAVFTLGWGVRWSLDFL